MNEYESARGLLWANDTEYASEKAFGIYFQNDKVFTVIKSNKDGNLKRKDVTDTEFGRLYMSAIRSQ